ncbi:SRPBCC family protein [Smaragdicoccus niigatensis]|uniref:SRPBCC family protein n=1 Tax=Smaragdicoccus niigatensis TaxID=359359 RepID=UPI00037D4580|nr:SRPBCC family protein [Smaragdicoccus niigatensis]
MTVNVLTEIVIDRPVSVVAAYASDPDNATDWYVNIVGVNWKTPKPAVEGSLVEFTAQFLGRKLVYTYEVAEVIPDARFVMRTADGPFPMETTYTFATVGDGKTLMTLRNQGEPSGFGKIMGRLMEIAMRRANTNDLQKLKSILEAR